MNVKISSPLASQPDFVLLSPSLNSSPSSLLSVFQTCKSLFQLGALHRLCCSLCPKWFFLWLPNLFTKALTPLFNISPSPSLYSYILSIIFLFCPIWYFSFLMKLNILCAVFSPFDFLLLSTLSIQGPAQCPAESNFLMILVKWMNWLEFVLANCRYIWRADPKLCSG